MKTPKSHRGVVTTFESIRNYRDFLRGKISAKEYSERSSVETKKPLRSNTGECLVKRKDLVPVE
ncbi:hypothetical protein JYJ95_37960 [Corallococcus exiguus]|uniref:hypothetical protein n=1 Tax=Corallococcus exiguus TaxID=83462 RepID=UPI0014709BF0|nr:hypothetical protein [Corallococcus exiguus]MBN8472323.1 hypothetical protein [Corallococcus exiguus]NNB89941.1 hypothetical protein [Corallococcus exiguus]